MNYFKKGLLFCLLTLFTVTGVAWERSVELGYGISQDPNNSKYNNSGFLLSGDVWPIWRSPLTYWSINGALGQWYTTAPNNKYVTTGAASVALRLYPMPCANVYPFYLLATVGPAYLSSKQYGNNKQGSNLAFQTIGGLGMEFDHIDANLRLVHYSNAGLAHPNQGYNILYLFSLGYLF